MPGKTTGELPKADVLRAQVLTLEEKLATTHALLAARLKFDEELNRRLPARGMPLSSKEIRCD